MLAFLQRRVVEDGLELGTICADMTAFVPPRRFAAAYNPLSSFRLIHDDSRAHAHLACVARALEPRGVYVLDLAFRRDAGETHQTTAQGWEMERDGVVVRADDDAIHVVDAGRSLELAWGAELHLRHYTVDQFVQLVRGVPELAIESWHPEVSRATGVSEFDVAPAHSPPAAGRAMVVLRRIR
jgi:hypothetical protein